MLSGLRPGTPLFVVFKNGPRVATAKVAQLSSQYPPQFNFPLQAGANNMAPMFDLTLELDGKTEVFQKIPINTSVAEFPDKGIILSETREGVMNEITAIQNFALGELEKRSFYEQTAANCKQILFDINPELKREQEQAAEIAALKKELSDMSGRFDAVNDQLAALTGMLSKSLGKKPKED